MHMRKPRLHHLSFEVVRFLDLGPMNFSVYIELIITVSVHEFLFILLIHLHHFVFINVRLVERHGDMQITLLLVIGNSINNSLSYNQIPFDGDTLVQFITGHMTINLTAFLQVFFNSLIATAVSDNQALLLLA
ncbi:hypothetical protein D3C72_1705920 [compost metagenome]